MMPRARRGQALKLPGILSLPPEARPVRAVKRAKRSAPAPKPWLAVVLAVDCASRSGWAICVVGKLCASGELDTLNTPAIEAVVAQALERAVTLGRPCVLVLEDIWGGSVSTIAGLGAARERWLAVWRALAGKVGHKGKVVRVPVSTWRAAILGEGYGSAERDQARPVEQSMARGIKGSAVGPDEAPAICLGRYGAQAGDVGKVIGERARKASLAAWTGGRG